MSIPGLTDLDSSLNEVSVASAATVDLGALAGRAVLITGTTTITSFGTGRRDERYIRFAAALTLTHNSTSLILPGGRSISTAAGDICRAQSDGSGNWRVTQYLPAVVPQGSAQTIAYTPTISASSGTITTVGTIAAAYMRISPKLVWVNIDVTITTNGTAAGFVGITLPFAPSAKFQNLAGREIGVGGKAITGSIQASDSVIRVVNYDNSYPGANGSRFILTGVYEIA